MIYAWFVFILCLAFGGITYYAMNEVYDAVLGSFQTALPLYFADEYTDFASATAHWLPFGIVLIGVMYVIVQSLRRSPDEVTAF